VSNINLDVNVNVNVDDVVLSEAQIAAIEKFVGDGGIATKQRVELDGFPDLESMDKAYEDIVVKYPSVKRGEVAVDATATTKDGVPHLQFALEFYVDVNRENALATQMAVSLARKKEQVKEYLKLKKQVLG
jgi:hypothetical protein